MKNSLTILGAALIVSLGLYFALQTPTGWTDPRSPNEVTRTLENERRRNMEAACNLLEIHLDDARQVARSLDEAFRKTPKGGYSDIATHAEEIVELAQKIRLETANLRRSDARIIRLLLEGVQHSAHELEDAARDRDHGESHHAFDNLKHEIERLTGEVKRLCD